MLNSNRSPTLADMHAISEVSLSDKLKIQTVILDSLETEQAISIHLSNNIQLGIVKKADGILVRKITLREITATRSSTSLIATLNLVEACLQLAAKDIGISMPITYRYREGDDFKEGLLFKDNIFVEFLKQLIEKESDEKKLFLIFDAAMIDSHKYFHLKKESSITNKNNSNQSNLISNASINNEKAYSLSNSSHQPSFNEDCLYDGLSPDEEVIEYKGNTTNRVILTLYDKDPLASTTTIFAALNYFNNLPDKGDVSINADAFNELKKKQDEEHKETENNITSTSISIPATTLAVSLNSVNRSAQPETKPIRSNDDSFRLHSK